ncbi:MAG: hypothetical protein EPN74_06360 [Rhodanobacter sp.]|nr:MAG: hypothetical protein EPN74_06360 [Rhodanobacter sp.]
MKSLPMLLCMLALGACSSGKPPKPRAQAVATPFDALKAKEQQARDVQKIVDKQAAQQRKQIQAQQR